MVSNESSSLHVEATAGRYQPTGGGGLRTGGHVRLLPDVHDIPRPGEERAQLTIVAAEVRDSGQPDPQPVRRACLSINRLKGNRPKIAGEPRGRNRRHLPAPASLHRHFVREATIVGDDVGVGDGYKAVHGSGFEFLWLPPSAFAKASADRRSSCRGWSGGR